jgi:peptidoglycan hydrolase CwlO-like protein
MLRKTIGKTSQNQTNHKDNLRKSSQNLKKTTGKRKELAENIRRGMVKVSLRHPGHD